MPCTFEAEDGNTSMKKVPDQLLTTIDFSRIASVATFRGDKMLHIGLVSWNDLFLTEVSGFNFDL